MPKKVAVIDLGSNSIRMAVFARTSRLGFYILAEYKIKVRLGEGAYENGCILQQEAMQKCFDAFGEFKKLIIRYKIQKVLCVGTSALRDAPNSKVFINMVKKGLGLNIRCIDGDMEAHLGGVAALNLLCGFKEATTIDIGGGSTELARIINGKVTQTLSLNIGTVRLKELFYDKKNLSGLSKFSDEIISCIPKDFKSNNIVTIGGSLRAISNAIMYLNKYPLKIIHNYCYKYEQNKEFIKNIANSSILDLNKFPIKKERYDTIREGAYIFNKVADFLGAKEIFTSGVGVREGVFLTSILGHNAKLPSNFSPSLKSLQDRYILENRANIVKFCKQIFDVLAPIHNLDRSYLRILSDSAKLCDIGSYLGHYAKYQHSSYIVLNGLNYCYNHKDKALIAAIIKLHGKKDLGAEFNDIKNLLPQDNVVIWLSFILELSKALDECGIGDLKFEFSNSTLMIEGVKAFILLKENIKKISKPAIFAITFN